jgi:hypothetical protein
VEVAAAHVRAGQAAFSRGDYEAAREEFVQAQALDPRTAVPQNLALSELRTNRPLDAYKHFRAFVADPSAGPEARAAVQNSMFEAYQHTGHLMVIAPACARVKVDGHEVGRAPLDDAVDLEAGPHGVGAEWNGTGAYDTVQVQAGEPTIVEVHLPTPDPTKACG